jgi:hypothetical protein
MIDTLFGGGGGKGYEDIQKGIAHGMDTRRDWENRAEQMLSPYMGDPRLMNQYEGAIKGGADPTALYKQIMGSYAQSPLAKIQTQAGMDAIRGGGAASGMHGSGQEMQDLQKNAQNISAADQQDYLSKILGMRGDYLNRLGGLAGNESQQQFNARNKAGGWRYGTGGALDEDLQAQGKARGAEDMARAGGWSNLFNTGLGLFGAGGGGIQNLLGPLAKGAMNFSF